MVLGLLPPRAWRIPVPSPKLRAECGILQRASLARPNTESYENFWFSQRPGAMIYRDLHYIVMPRHLRAFMRRQFVRRPEAVSAAMDVKHHRKFAGQARRPASDSLHRHDCSPLDDCE